MRASRAIAVVLALLLAAVEAAAWGASGHRWVTATAAGALPDEIPAFVRSAQAVALLGELAVEPDRSKGAGAAHDAERDPAHYVDLDDAGRVAGVVALDALPATRAEYDARLRRARRTQYTAGYLPYALVDGWQQVRKDFALWRVAVVGARAAATSADRAWFEEDRRRREALTLRDIGVFSHYVADASQPLHVTVHFNGWGPGPNPRRFTTAPTLHGWFEGGFVRRFVPPARIRAALRPYRDCRCPVEARVAAHLRATWLQVVPLYALERAGGLAEGDPRGVDFAVERLAAGASETRDLIVDAWRASADVLVGRPEASVRQIEAGAAPPRPGPFTGEE